MAFDWRRSTRIGRVLFSVAGQRLADRLAHAGFPLIRWTAHLLFFVAPPLLLAAAALGFGRDPALAGWLAVAGILLAVIGIDAFVLEPRRLTVSRHRIVSPNTSRPFRIVLVADLQSDHFGGFERRVLRAVVAEHPDLIAFAGDYLQPWNHADWDQQVGEMRDFMCEIGMSAPLGAYAVRGNVDPVGWAAIFAGTGVRAFEKTTTVSRPKLTVTALSLPDSFSLAPVVPDADGFHVVIGHCPNYALGTRTGDLLLAGHTHGGQVRLPLVGALLTMSLIPRRWAAGVTDLGAGRRLVVSRGIGLERGAAPRMRFLCAPEIVVLDVTPPDS